MLAIEAKKVSKWFGKKKYKAISNLSLKVEPNQIFGLLGSNGAGKTTLLSIFATTLLPSEGTVKIFGEYVVKDKLAVREMINICSGYSGLFDAMTVEENMIYYARMRKIKNPEKRITKFIRLVDLKKERKIKAEDLSTGMRQRLSLALALLSNPKLLLLDEPTAGLDPKIAARIRASIKKIQEQLKMTIILTTHNMYEAEQLCNNIAILKRGKLITIKTVAGLRKLIGDYQIIEVETRKNIKKLVCKGIKSMEQKGEKTILRVIEIEKNLIPLLKELNKYDPKKVSVREPTLEEVYIALA